jgi:catechol 2,3-dioxygenase-like lactoylglutathione lyase family enzyme
MRFNHLGLPVRIERRSQQFYSDYFGFDPATAQKYPGVHSRGAVNGHLALPRLKNGPAGAVPRFVRADL